MCSLLIDLSLAVTNRLTNNLINLLKFVRLTDNMITIGPQCQ